ncbi:MAG: multiubiquitin domain-containing protein [Bacteroidetes bacterium]|nr:multiubiquitin domain-containing protein [Bacteroidota bacterium]
MKDDLEKDHENGKHELRLVIDGKQYKWTEQYITGAEVRKLGGIPQENEIFLAIKKPWEDEFIQDDTKIDLARPGIEHFFTVKPIELPVVIIVNGRERSWDRRLITFEEVVKFAFDNYVDNGNTLYTVTYKRGPEQNPEGTMVKGDRVFVKHKMIFNVTPTDKS